jgi:dipeptidyl aminopeptidase/acylaminoacyl peptidase
VIRRRWTVPRALALALIACAWLAAGLGVYLALGVHPRAVAAKASRPDQVQTHSSPLQRLPGTLYLVQDGTLYRLQQGVFTPLLNANGSTTWTMPAVSPNGQNLVVVRRNAEYSDLYLVDAAGNVQQQLTHDASSTVELNHWALYPKLGADGSTLWFNYDPKDVYNDYNVVMAVWSMPLGGRASQMRKWTTPNDYTGGDVQPVPLPSGGVIYTRYALDTTVNKILGQLWLTTRAGSVGVALTPAADDCSQPALSPDGTRLAMICTGGTQIANVEVATLQGTTLGPRQVVVSGQQAAQPTWSPDGQSLVYLAAQGISGHFQLWQQDLPPPPPPPTVVPTPIPTRPAAPGPGVRVGSPTPTPSPPLATPSPTPTPLPPPVILTSALDFDATSTIAWRV